MRRSLVRLALWLALVMPGARAWAQDAQGGLDLSTLQIPPGFLDLSDVEFSGSDGRGFAVSATTTLMNARSQVLVSTSRDADGKRHILLGLRPDHWSLSESFPALANPVLDALPLDNVALVVSDQDIRMSAAMLSLAEIQFYSEVYHSNDFTLVLKPGVNLIAAIPSDRLPPDHPLLAVMNALGIEHGNILLQGTLGRSLTMLQGGVSAAALKDLYLRAELPPMRPPGSPDWFRSGQLALELTGDPSIRLVGEMNVTIDEADLQFYLAAMLARSGVSLAGGMVAVRPWVAPFGIEWLTMKSVVLKIGITPTGSVTLGFGGAAVIGSKDIDVAVGISVSPAGVPTNFMMRGASEAGVGLSDLVQVQAAMAAARDAAASATGVAGGEHPAIPIDALPDIDIRSIDLQFAPKADLDLGIERGFKIKGRLWLPLGPGGQLSDFAGVDAGLTDEGLWIRGDLGAFRVGPLTWDDAVLDLTATRQEQHLIVRGQVQLGMSRQLIDLYVGRDALRFRSETELFGLFHAELTCQAAFNLTNPSFVVDAVMNNDFGEYLQPMLRDGILRFATAGQGVIDGAQSIVAVADRVLINQQATAAQLRATLTAMRANAEAAWSAANSRAATLLASANSARSARDAAWRLWDNTPRLQVALRTARYADYVRRAAVYATRTTAYAVQRTAADARRAILDAIPPVDQNVLLLAADALVAELRRRVEEAQSNLNELSARYAAIIAAIEAGADPLAIQYASFHADLSALQGGAVAWTVRGVFIGQPFELRRQFDFGSPVQAVAGILSGLVSS